MYENNNLITKQNLQLDIKKALPTLIKECRGMEGKVCRKAGITRSQYEEMREEDEVFAKECDKAKEIEKENLLYECLTSLACKKATELQRSVLKNKYELFVKACGHTRAAAKDDLHKYILLLKDKMPKEIKKLLDKPPHRPLAIKEIM